MSRTFFTKEQKEAIAARNKNILVSAGAGSGKTAVLVERIVNRIIYDKINIDEIVVVTFTELAAREMKERIAIKFKEQLEINSNNKHLLKQRNLLPNASISTIHSFCNKLIKNNFNNCDVDPNFKILDNKEVSMLKDNVITEIFAELYEQGEENFLELVELYGDKIADDSLKEIILRIYDNAINNPFPEEWLDKILEYYEISEDNVNNNIWIDSIKKQCDKTLENIIYKLNNALEICQNYDGLEKYFDLFTDDLSKIKHLKNDILANDFFDVNYNIDFGRFPTLKSKDNDIVNIKNIIKSIRDEYKKDYDSFKKHFFVKTKETFLEETNYLKMIFENIISIVKLFKNKYNEEKIKISSLDYNDLEQLALKLLVDKEEDKIKPTKLALQLKSKYKEILVDEYQDCNDIQETIFNYISNGNNMFMVGDVKQSIYGFRHAKPQLFINKFNTYNDLSSMNEKIILAKNFRSNRNVINSTNFIFEQIMTSKVGGINYNNEVSLKKGLIKKIIKKPEKLAKGYEVSNSQTKGELNLLIGNFEKEKLDDNKISKNKFEGIIIANKIFDLVNSNKMIFDKKKNITRKINYKDIVILTRSKKNVNDISSALKEKGIPYVSTNKGNFFEYVEIQILISYLQILDNQYQEIPLLSILKSPIYALTSDELIKIKNTNPTNFFNKIEEYIKLNNGEVTVDKLKRFISDYEDLKRKSKLLTISEIIEDIIMTTNLEMYISILANHKIRLGNIKVLIQTAKEYEKTSYSTLFNFVNYAMQLKSNNVQIDDSIVNHENSDVVKILSIHKSKGLEFPVVFISNLNSKFNRSDENQKILIHSELGIGSKSVNLQYRVQSNTYQKLIISRNLKLDLIAEELRILYVAMTRAEAQIYLVATTDKLLKDIEKAEKLKYTASTKFSSSNILNCNSYYEMILLCFLRHRNWFNGIDVKNKYIYNYNINLNFEIKTLDNINLKSSTLDMNKTDVNITNLLSEVKSNSQLDNNNKYIYKNYLDIQTKNKITISDLKRRANYDENDEVMEIKKPSFLNEGVKNINLGIIYHKILEKIDLTKENGKEDVNLIIEQLLKNNFMTEEELKNIKLSYIYNFINSELAARIRKSKKVEKEKSFVLAVNKDDFFDIDLDDNSFVLLNGIIDCYFIENNEIVVVDFKSDYIENVEKFLDKYSLQLNIYKKAIEKSGKYKVKEMIIYSLRNGKAYKV